MKNRKSKNKNKTNSSLDESIQQKVDRLGHGKPITRRDFISRGLIAGGGIALAPTLWGSLVKSSYAENIGVGPLSRPNAPGGKTIPFIVLDLSGGAALHANFLVGGRGGPEDLLPSYSQMGWNPRSDVMDRRFGLPMAGGGVSKILEGITVTASPEAQSGLRFGGFAHVAQIDTDINPLSALSLVSASGAVGRYVATPVGLRTSLSGGRSKYALESELYRAFSVRTIDDLINAIGFSGGLQTLSYEAKGKLGKFLRRLSNSQFDRFMNLPEDQALRATLDNNLGTAQTLASASSALDPRSSEIFARVYGLNQNTAVTDPNVLRAGLVMGALTGGTGPAVITIEGCDYHDQSQATGDTKDREIGVEIGRIIQVALELKTPVFLQIITDGGIYPQSGTRIWAGDSTETCMSAIGYFHPTAAPEYKFGRKQIGWFTSAQGADRTTLIGERPLFAAYAAFANYLSVCGRVGQFSDYVSGGFDRDQLESTLIF